MAIRIRTAGTQNQAAGALVGVVFTVVGIGALVGGIFWGMRTKAFIATAERAQGRVIELVAKQDDDGTSYSPKVQFTAKDGATIEFTSSISSRPPSHQEGDVVGVLYQPDAPRNAKIDEFMELWFGPLIVGGVFGVVFSLVGILVTLSGIGAMVKKRRLRRDGLRIMAQVQGVEGANGAYTIVASATDTRGIQRIFRSAPVASDPGPKMLGRTAIEVIVDPDDWGTYEIDLSFLKQ